MQRWNEQLTCVFSERKEGIMRFDEVVEMEEELIDENVLEELCSPNIGPSMIPDVYAVLILHCFRKYDERYGTNLTDRVKIPQMVMGFDTGYEEEMIWYEEVQDIMEEAIYASGWHAAWISTEMDGLRESMEGKNEEEMIKKDFHDAYIGCLDLMFQDGFVKSCFMMEEESVLEAAQCLESGEIGIMWNEKLDRYMRRRSAERDVVDVVCPDEDRYIARLSREVWEPYMTNFMQDEVEYTGREYAGRKYCRIVLGSDGYNFCWYDSINPNWIFRAMKLNHMLDLALEKLEGYKKRKEEEAA